MAQIYFPRWTSGVLIGAYISAISSPDLYANRELAETSHDLGDAISVMASAGIGASGPAMAIDMTPNTVVDKQYYNVWADFIPRCSGRKMPQDEQVQFLI